MIVGRLILIDGVSVMNTLEVDNTDRWIIRSNDFVSASQYAAKQKWALREWAWLPAYTISKDLQIFERRV